MAIIMAMSTPVSYSIADARNQLTGLVRSVEKGRTVGLTRRGRLVAVVVSEAEYRRISVNGNGLREALRSFLDERPARGAFTTRAIASLRDRRPARAVSW